ncbi:P1 family peptidase [Deinococcus sp. YIM 134068]|uniref:DmpA family aminopeptidase n=1 Tax=Deinococcus lichenicola TaxID=3118910 RepID=UPI002F949F4D
MRLRDVGLPPVLFGPLPTGPLNAITDVMGVRVGHTTLISGEGPLVPGRGPVRTGVTVVHPRPGLTREQPCFAGVVRHNGNGDLTGAEWLREAGTLATPLALTNTHALGTVRDAMIAWEGRQRTDAGTYWCMPVVGETFDGTLNDIWGGHVREEHVWAALETATNGPVPEGNVGGGTGMICHGFKGGIGTSSRVVDMGEERYTVGVLVQANHGRRTDLRVLGLPVGRVLTEARVPTPWTALTPGSGSIVVILATDAPLLPGQCERLARRAGVGLSRTGGGCDDSSGDFFVCFATGNEGLPVADYARRQFGTVPLRMVSNDLLNLLFHAAADATEEAVLNALLGARTLTGADGRTAHALTPDLLRTAVRELTVELGG